MSPAGQTLGTLLPSYQNFVCVPQSITKLVSRMLQDTSEPQKDWGIQFCRPSKSFDNKLVESEPSEDQQQVDKLPIYPEPIATGKLIGFVDAAFANDFRKGRLTTGHVFTYSGDVVVYRSKTQSLKALSSMEAAFIAAVTAAKTAKCIRFVLCKLGFK